MHLYASFMLIFMCCSMTLSAQYIPSIASQDANGRMQYIRDTGGNRIPNFSHAGYRGGGIDLPEVDTKLTILPIEGDNTAHIQAAIDSVSSFPPDDNGYRGALLLDTGRYEIHGILYVNTSGVVLRGQGDGADPSSNTVLIGVGNVPNQRDILVVGGGSGTRWEGRVPNTSTLVSSDRVLVGEYKIGVEKPELFNIGDNVIINHTSMQTWVDAIGGGGAVSEGPWGSGSQPLVFNRRVVDISDDSLILDVPIYNTLDKTLSPSFVYAYDRQGVVTEVGVENLRIDIQTAGGNDEAHAWNALALKQVEDAWVKNCTFLHFGLAGVYTSTASRITITDCEALDPVAQITGARMYNFNLLTASSQVLIKDCYASNGRHHYVSNGTSSVSGCVFLNCVSSGAYAASEGHRRWSMGLLYDNLQEIAIRENRILLGLYNRGDYGTAHGWSAAHSVAWNCDVGTARLVVQKPPTAQNYAVACKGQVSGNGPWPGQVGYIEGTGQADVLPSSLYQAQLNARLAGLESVVTDMPPTNIDSDLGNAVQVYPNPSHGKLLIKMSQSDPFKVIISDLQGRKISSFKGSQTWEGDFPYLPEGYYLIEIRRNNESQWLKWMKH